MYGFAPRPNRESEIDGSVVCVRSPHPDERRQVDHAAWGEIVLVLELHAVLLRGAARDDVLDRQVTAPTLYDASEAINA
jgi:hypothetical protein